MVFGGHIFWSENEKGIHKHATPHSNFWKIFPPSPPTQDGSILYILPVNTLQSGLTGINLTEPTNISLSSMSTFSLPIRKLFKSSLLCTTSQSQTSNQGLQLGKTIIEEDFSPVSDITMAPLVPDIFPDIIS